MLAHRRFAQLVKGKVAGLGRSPAQTLLSKQTQNFCTATVEKSSWVKPGYEKAVGLWLTGTAGFVVGQIVIGGYTRLSGSGLSMTSWRPQGNWLPTTAESWEDEFTRYKQTPEFERQNSHIDMDGFKRIFFVEWFHRMWGRGTGLFFALPLGYFTLRGALMRPLQFRLAGLLALGASQAVVGWWMVKSGFDKPEEHMPHSVNKRPRVSAYRIAFHWTAALALYGGVFWCALTLLRPNPAMIHQTAQHVATALKLRAPAQLVGGVTITTLISGAFVAGNDAGLAYNTWPKMIDDWVPPEVPLAFASGEFRKFFEDTACVQFDHRMLAYSTVLSGATLALFAYGSAAAPAVKTAAIALGLASSGQMMLGVYTLLSYVPTELGVAHQANGVAVLSAVLFLLHVLRVPVPLR